MNDHPARSYPRWSQFLLSVLLGWLGLSMSMAQAQPMTLRLTADSLSNKPDGLALQPYSWQFHPGDNRAWADTSVDDRRWASVHSEFGLKKPLPGWQGLGWFRFRMAVGSSLVGKPLALRLWHKGASEIYLDGRLIGEFGTVGPSKEQTLPYWPFRQTVPLHIPDSKPHLIAIRYANFDRYFSYASGFSIWIGGHDQISNSILNYTRLNGYGLFFTAANLAFALLHFFLFLFYPKQKLNLYYSLSMLFFAINMASFYYNSETTDPATQQLMMTLFDVSKVLAVTLAIILLYSIGYSSIAAWRIGFLGVGTGYFLIIYLFFPEKFILNSYTTFFVLSTLDGLWAVGQAVRRRQPGVWLIGLGMLIVALVFLFVAVDLFNLWRGTTGKNLVASFGFLALPISFSLYLALDFARTNRDLATQLRQVEELSAQTLAQEAEKLQLVAQQNEQLEQTVRERTGQLQQQTDKLREMDRVKSRFFTNLTHEFRTPLTLILGPAEQVLADTQEPKTKQRVGLLQRNAQRLLQLINQLLDLSKLEAGKLELTTAPGDLISLVKGTLLSFESLAGQKQITLRFTATPDRLVMAIDRDKLEKILSNVLSNALKFTPAGGDVLVAITCDQTDEGPWVQLSIQDTGVGIPVAKLPYIFDRFYQVDASDTREQEGTGIGLALTNELVELHGGSIDISSQPGVGTTVTVRLPIQQEQFVEATPESELPPATPLTPASPSLPDSIPESADAPLPLVLLIDDNDDVRTFIRSSLDRSAGADSYRIIDATNGAEGVRLAQQQVPDLVITDLMMPKMDGYQVCALLKGDERTSHIPVIMLTAKADMDSKLEGLETGADAYLAKPFNQRELLAQIANLIALRRQLRERYRQINGWPTDMASLPSMEQAFLGRVRSAIESHLDDEQYSVERLSDDIGLSRTQLHRKLKALINQTPGDLMRLIRLQRAHELLSGNVGTVAEVAYQVGFGNPANFSTSFSRHFGYAPSEVRKKVSSAAS